MKEFLDLQLDSEVTKLNKVTNIQEEVENLNKSLNACIDLVSESIGNEHTLEKLRRMKEENDVVYARAINDIDETIEKSRDNIEEIRKEKKDLEDHEEENAKGSEA